MPSATELTEVQGLCAGLESAASRNKRTAPAPCLDPPVLEKRLGSLVCAFESDPRVCFAYLFGSRARGRVSARSDVDVALMLARDVDASEALLDFIALSTRILRTDNVDIVILNGAPIALRYRIVRDRRVLFERDHGRRIEFESLTMREGFDFAIFEREHMRRRYGRGR